MKVLVIGGTGMLGHKLVQVMGAAGHETFATIRGRFEDVERFGIFERDKIIGSVSADDTSAVEDAIRSVRPDVVLNAVGVIKQVDASKAVVPTLMANAIFPQKVADLARQNGFRFITISTDCVFAGDRGNYTESDEPDALDLYGISKRFGEIHDERGLTIRTSIIGRELASAHGLVEWFLSNRGKTVKGFRKAIFSGLPTVALAKLIARIVESHADLKGLYHVSANAISKYDLLSLVKARLGLPIEIVADDDFSIDRSLDSSRFRSATGIEPADWPELIDEMCADSSYYDDLRGPGF